MIQVSNNSRKTALVSAKLQTVINNRLREFFSFIIAGVGLVFLFALLSYNFDDPSFRNATGLVPKNMIGFLGSYSSDILFTSLGLASFCLPIVFLSWSYRILIKGKVNFLFRRAIFLPVTLFIGALFFSTNESPNFWNFANGLGGITGDTCLEYLLKNHPIEINLWLKLISIASALLFFLCLSFSSGLDRFE